MSETHRLENFDMTLARLQREWVITIDTPKAGAEGTVQKTAACQIIIAIEPDQALLRETFALVFSVHVNEEPTIRVSEQWGSRSKLLDDKDNPHRYWNRSDADKLHGRSVG